MRYIIFTFSLIMPLYALGFAFFESAKRRPNIILIFSISLAFSAVAFAISPPPEYDLFRHYERIISYNQIPLGKILETSSPGYLLFGAYSWVIHSLGLPIQFFSSSIVFLSYFIVLLIFNDVKVSFLQNCKTSIIATLLVTLCFSVGFVGLSSGLRNPLANIIILHAGYQLFFYNRFLLFILLSFLSFFIHPFSVIPALAVLIANILSKFPVNGKPLILLGFFFIFSSNYLTLLFSYIDYFFAGLTFYNESYFDPESMKGGRFSEQLNTTGLIANRLVSRLSFYIGAVYLILVKPKKNDPIHLLLCGLFFYLSFFYFFNTLFSRMYGFFNFILIIYLFIQYSWTGGSLKKLFIYLAFITVFANNLLGLYEHRDYLLTATSTLYKPLPLMLIDVDTPLKTPN